MAVLKDPIPQFPPVPSLCFALTFPSLYAFLTWKMLLFNMAHSQAARPGQWNYSLTLLYSSTSHSFFKLSALLPSTSTSSIPQWNSLFPFSPSLFARQNLEKRNQGQTQQNYCCVIAILFHTQMVRQKNERFIRQTSCWSLQSSSPRPQQEFFITKVDNNSVRHLIHTGINKKRKYCSDWFYKKLGT